MATPSFFESAGPRSRRARLHSLLLPVVLSLSAGAWAHGTDHAGYSIFEGTMADMTYTEYEAAVRNGAVALWGLGVIEEHGPHLPLGSDAYLPTAYLTKARSFLAEKNVPSIVVPAYYWGVNHVTGSFPGSIHVRPEIMVEVMVDVFRSLSRDGVRQVFCITGHGDADHIRAIYEGVKRGTREAGLQAFLVMPPAFAQRLGLDPKDPHLVLTAPPQIPPKPHPDVHAGDMETSLLWGLYPRTVREELIPKLEPTNLDMAALAEWRKGHEHARRVTPNGYFGDPASADPERGRRQAEQQARLIAEAIAGRLSSLRQP